MGQGKSTFLLSLIEQDIAAGRGLCILDPHGRLVDDTLDLIAGSGRERDVRLIDLASKEVAFGLNLLACPDPTDPDTVSDTAELVFGIFKERWGDMSWGARMEDLLLNAIYTLIANAGATIGDLIPLLTKEAVRKKLVQRLHDDVVRPFWEDEYAKLSDAARGQMIGPVTNKVRTLTRNPTVGPIVRQRENTISWETAIREHQLVLVKLAPRQEENSNLIGTFIIHQILEAAFGRDKAEADANPFMLYFDECHRFVTQAFAKLLREARKFGLATTAATQFDSELPETLSTVFTSSSTLVCFRLGDEDAKRLQSKFDGSALALAPTYEPDPLGTLLSKGHADTRLVELARRVELALTEWQARKDAYLKRYNERHYAPSIATAVKQARLALDAYLFAAQRGDPAARVRLEEAGELLIVDPLRVREADLVPLWPTMRLGEALQKNPLQVGSANDRAKMAFELSHLAKHTALVSYDRGSGRAEAVVHTIQPAPSGATFRPKPLGIPREKPAPPPPPPSDAETDPIYFDAGPEPEPGPPAPPPFFERR